VILCRFCNERFGTLAEEHAHIFEAHYKQLMNERAADRLKAGYQRDQKRDRELERGMDYEHDET